MRSSSTTLKYRASRETVAGWRADLGTGAGSPLLRAYLELSLVCQYIVDDRNVTIAAAVQRFHDVPLIEYRAGLCGPAQAPHLTAVREANPDFADVDLALGRYALDIPQQPDQDEGCAASRRRARRFPSRRPSSPALARCTRIARSGPTRWRPTTRRWRWCRRTATRSSAAR